MCAKSSDPRIPPEAERADDQSRILLARTYLVTTKKEIMMGNNTRMHDGIAGALVLLGTVLGYFVSVYWLVLPGALGALMLQSAFTGFCPVYYTLDKVRGGAAAPKTT